MPRITSEMLRALARRESSDEPEGEAASLAWCALWLALALLMLWLGWWLVRD